MITLQVKWKCNMRENDGYCTFSLVPVLDEIGLNKIQFWNESFDNIFDSFVSYGETVRECDLYLRADYYKQSIIPVPNWAEYNNLSIAKQLLFNYIEKALEGYLKLEVVDEA